MTPRRSRTSILALIALVAYVSGIAVAVVATIYRSALARRVASALWIAAWLAHGGAVAATAISEARLPLANRAEFLLVLGWAVQSLHLFVWFSLRVWIAGLVLPPIAAVATAVAWVLHSRDQAVPVVTGGGWFLFHVTTSTLGLAILCVAFAMSLLFLVQDRALKSKRGLPWLDRLPALETCDRFGFQALVIGFVLLTVGITTGVVVNANIYEQLWVLGAKQVFPLLSWLVFAGLIASRRVFGFRGRKSAYITIAGFTLGLLTVIGINL